MKHLSSLFLFASLLFIPIPFQPLLANEDVISENPPSQEVIIYVFSRDDCRHCQNEKIFLDDLENRYDFIKAVYLDIYTEPYATQWREIAQLEGFPLATPLTIVGNTVLSGFDTKATTGKKIETIALEQRNLGSLTPREIIEKGGSGNGQISGFVCDSEDETGICTLPPEETKEPLDVSLPFIGTFDVSVYSLPILSLVLGFIDGFNPCALWVLVTFLLVLAQSRSRKKMAILAGFFILAQGIVYALILNVWFTTWNFVALDSIVTPLIGIVAIGGGMFFLYEWSQAKGTCKIVNVSRREKMIRRIKDIASSPLNPTTLLAILLLALSVSIIEFACSIGIPQAYTKILEINALSFLEQQFMMGLYLLTYMLDDIVVFGIAIWSMDKIGLTAKYSSFTNLLGGVLMLILGFLLLLAPDVLQFV